MDEKFVVFANAVAGEYSPESETLQLPSGTIDMYNNFDDTFKSFFVHDAYPQLYLATLLRNKGEGVYILGTPSTGKSCSRPYFCHRFINDASDKGKVAYILFIKAGAAHRQRDVYVVRHKPGESAKILIFKSHEFVDVSN
jgi:hypothetical protein